MVRQSNLNSLSRFPPRLVDRGTTGEVVPPRRASFARGTLCTRRDRNPRRHNPQEQRSRTPQSASSRPRREIAVEALEIIVFDDEEQLSP